MICIYCLQEWSPKYLSKEHVIPKSLGGPLVLRKAACRDCNSHTANQLDTFLANTFPPTLMARAELDLRGHSGEQPQMLLTGMDPDLGPVDMLLKRGADGTTIKVKPLVEKQGETLIAIAPTVKQAPQMLSRAIRRDVKWNEIGDKGFVKATTFQAKEPVDWDRAHRAASKILYCYLLLELGERILPSPPMGILRDYLFSATGSGQIIPDVPVVGLCDVPRHHHVLMFDSGNNANNWVCLFGIFWFRFLLDLSTLAPHGRFLSVDPVSRSVVEPITKYRGNWHPRTSIKWGWKRQSQDWDTG